MNGRLVVMAAALLALGAPSIRADATAERFRLITADSPERLERRLGAAGADGYRLVGSGRGISAGGTDRLVVLVERGPEDGPFEYVVVASSGKLASTDGPAVDRYAALGYRLAPHGVLVRRMIDHWLPETSYDDQMVLILERRPGQVAPHRYASLAFGSFGPFYAALEERRREAFVLLGMWNSGRRLQVLLEGPVSAEGASGVTASETYRLLIPPTRRELRSKLRRSARDGYRVVAAADPSITGPPIVLMRKAEEPATSLEYRLLTDVPKKLHRDELDRKLNGRARRGFRPCPAGSTGTVLMLERDPKADAAKSDRSAEPTAFLALTSTDPRFSSRLAQAFDSGYGYLGLYVEPGQTTVLLRSRGRTAAGAGSATT